MVYRLPSQQGFPGASFGPKPGQIARGAIFFGLALIGLGVAAIVLPQAFSMAIQALVGGVFVAIGVLLGLVGLTFRGSGGAGIGGFAGILSAGIGVTLLAFPLVGLFALTLGLVILLTLDALTQGIRAFWQRPRKGWGYRLLSASFSLTLAGLLIVYWPRPTVWLVGLIFGLALISKGLALTFFGFALRRAAQPHF